jgi:hypothetical protein
MSGDSRDMTIIHSEEPRCDQGRDPDGTWPTMRCQLQRNHEGRHMAVHEVLTWEVMHER